MQLEEVRRIIRETGQPEVVPTLTWTKPDKAIEHRLYHPRTSVDRRQRPGDEMVPCSLCGSDHPKCLTFYLLWSADGHLRVVGHICGPKYFGEREFRDMEHAAQAAASRQSNEDFLLENLPRLHLWLGDLDALAPLCDRAQRLRRAFASNVPSLHHELLRMDRDHGGVLVVMRKRAGDGPSGFRSSMGAGEAEYDALPVAPLRGATFLRPSYNPSTEVARIRASLAELAGGRGLRLSENDALEVVCEMSEAELASAVRTISDAHRRAAQLVGRLGEIAAFVSEANIDALEQWGQHDENQMRFTVERTERGVSFRVKWNEKVTLNLRENLRPPPLQTLGR